jgi:chemotaxis protein MotD
LRPADRIAAVLNDLKLQSGSAAAVESASDAQPIIGADAIPDDAGTEPARAPRIVTASEEPLQRGAAQTAAPVAAVPTFAASPAARNTGPVRDTAAQPLKRTVVAAVASDTPQRPAETIAMSTPEATAKQDIAVAMTVPSARTATVEADPGLRVPAERSARDDRIGPDDEPAPTRAVDAAPKAAAAPPASTAQSVPATPATTIVSAVAGDHSVRQLARAVAVQAAQSEGTSAHSLKIQLHPAELGMVTATLRMAGDRISVEIATDRAEAYERLSLDSDTIVKSLRALGLQIDQVTVQPPQLAVSASVRADTDTQTPSGAARDQQFAQAGHSSGGESGSRSGNQASRGNGNDGATAQEASAARENRDARGLFI